MSTRSVTDPIHPDPREVGLVEVGLQLVRNAKGAWGLRVFKRTTSYFVEVDGRYPDDRSLSLAEVNELLATVSDVVQAELLSRRGVQLSLGGY